MCSLYLSQMVTRNAETSAATMPAERNMALPNGPPAHSDIRFSNTAACQQCPRITCPPRPRASHDRRRGPLSPRLLLGVQRVAREGARAVCTVIVVQVL